MKKLSPSLDIATEIIYINDGSRDKTRELLDGIAASDPQVKVIHFSRNFGHQPAVTAGINNCDADLAVILDADMQDPPELIPGILELQEKEHANVVYCVRKSREGESFFKKITSKAFYRLLNSEENNRCHNGSPTAFGITEPVDFSQCKPSGQNNTDHHSYKSQTCCQPKRLFREIQHGRRGKLPHFAERIFRFTGNPGFPLIIKRHLLITEPAYQSPDGLPL